MAEPIKEQNAVRAKFYNYKSRTPYFNSVRHLNDNFLHLGYDYKGQLYRKSTSAELWGNPLQLPLIGRLEGIMTFLIENVKYIKKTFSVAHSKETLDIN